MFPGADGQLCNTFFKHFIVEFDFTQNEIILHDPKKFVYNGNGSVLDMQLTETGTYSVPFQITMKDGKIYEDSADIDLGGIYSFKVALNTNHSIQPPSNAKTRPFFGGIEYIAKIETYKPPLVPVHIPGKKTPMMEFDEQEEIRATSIDELRDATKQNIEARCGNITQFIEK